MTLRTLFYVQLFLYLLLNSFLINAQKNIIFKLNLANAIVEDFPTIQVEKSIFKSNSIQFGVGFYSKKHQQLPADVLNSTINGKPAREILFDEVKKCLLILDFRQYFTKKKTKLSGFYLSPHVMVNYPMFEKFMFGANLGFQKVLKNRMVVNLGSGMTKELDMNNLKNEVAVQPRLQFGFGFSF